MEILNKNDQIDLNNIILILANKYNIDRIFLNTYTALGKSCYQLVILLANKEHRSIGELDPKIKMSLKNYSKFHHVTLVAFQVKSKLIDGNVFLHNTCHPDKLIYQNSLSKFDLYPEGLSREKTLNSTKELFELENHKINEFREGYFCFKERGALTHAGFMLHQVFELRYRCMESLVMGRARVTHSIRSHHRCLVNMAPALTDIFIEGHPKDEILLQFLEKIYRAARYENETDVEPDILIELEEKMEKFIQITNMIFQDSITEFKNFPSEIGYPKDKLLALVKRQPFPVEEISNTKDNQIEHDLRKSAVENKLEQIIAYLKKSKFALEIYLLGHRTRSIVFQSIDKPSNINRCNHYFDLLIVSKNDIRQKISTILNSINMELDASILPLCFTPEQIQKQLDKNNPFFHCVLCSDDMLLHSELKGRYWHFHENRGQRTEQEFVTAQISWHQRMDNANGFLYAGKSIERAKEAMVKIFLYNQALEQACLGLLEFFYGYTPYHYNLTHLLNLCCTLWNFSSEIFPRDSKAEIDFFNNVANSIIDTRYKTESSLTLDLAYQFENRCVLFLQKCKELDSENALT